MLRYHSSRILATKTNVFVSCRSISSLASFRLVRLIFERPIINKKGSRARQDPNRAEDEEFCSFCRHSNDNDDVLHTSNSALGSISNLVQACCCDSNKRFGRNIQRPMRQCPVDGYVGAYSSLLTVVHLLFHSVSYTVTLRLQHYLRR